MLSFSDLISLWPVFLLAVGLTVVYALVSKHRDTVVFGSTALGVLLAVAGIMQSTANTRDAARQERLRVAFDYSARLNSPEASLKFEQAAAALETVAGKTPVQIDSLFAQELISEPLKFVFNSFEEVGQAVRVGYGDERAICTLFRDMALKYFSRLKPWLDHHRSQTQNYKMYEPYEWLNNRWASGCPSED